MAGFAGLMGDLAMASAIASTPGGYQAYTTHQNNRNTMNLIVIVVIVLIIVGLIIFLKTRSGYENVGPEKRGRQEEEASNEVIVDYTKYSRF